MNKYRCPNCSSISAINTNRIFDGRILFNCEKCDVCCVLPFYNNLDETYLEFLERYDNRSITTFKDLSIILEQESIIRSREDIKKIIKNNNISSKLLIDILFSEVDYVVDIKKYKKSYIKFGTDLEDLPIDNILIAQIKNKNIKKLYKFQEEAIIKILKNKDVVISAPTASGKTEAFCIPIIQKILEIKKNLYNSEKNVWLKDTYNLITGKILAIFVYPTKALSRDQLLKIQGYTEPAGVKVKILDGDVGDKEKQEFYDNPPDIVLTNFDSIHYHSINKTRLLNLLKTAEFLVIDEVHTYTGIFGANVYFIIKRLERLLNNKKLQIIASSATLPNAQEFCNLLFDRKMEVIIGDGERGDINFIIICPTMRSKGSLIIELIKKMTDNYHKTLIFSNSHLSAELLAYNSKKLGVKIGVHRAGLLYKVRKIIENTFKAGKLDAISSTPTLELGLDIGDVDSVISNLVPINRLVQRFGRAARKGQEGFAFLVLGNDPISQYYKNHPDDYFKDEEIPYTDPLNPIVTENQILAMCNDKPMTVLESRNFINIVHRLKDKKLLKFEDGKYSIEFTALKILKNYNIRGIGKEVDIIFNNKIIGSRNLPQALEELYKSAIYFVAGNRYKVKNLIIERENERYIAELDTVSISYPYYTKAITEEFPEILEILEEKKIFGIQLKYCSLKIIKKVIGYSNIEIGKEVNQGRKEFFEEPILYEYVTKGFIFRVPKPTRILEKILYDSYVEISGYHATEHVIIEGSSILTGGASQDMGGISLGDTGMVVIHDGSIGGNGASKSLFDKFERAILRGYTILSECPCNREDGCPRCTYSYRCGNNNEYLHKKSALEIMFRIIEGEKTEVTTFEQLHQTLV